MLKESFVTNPVHSQLCSELIAYEVRMGTPSHMLKAKGPAGSVTFGLGFSTARLVNNHYPLLDTERE